MSRLLLPLSLVLLAACGDKTPDEPGPGGDTPTDDTASTEDDTASTDDTGDAPVDADGDGYAAEDDCDDADPAVHPGATETCNGIDDDCDDLVDDADDAVEGQVTFYADTDGDGFGDAAVSTDACEQPTGMVSDDTDCDDTDAAVNPGAAEVCNDGIDDDCNGTADDADAGITDQSTWFADTDADGYGDPATGTDACLAPSDHVADDTDCDDTDAAVNPAALEICNDGVDDDCSGDADDADAGVTDAATWFADTDGDTYGDATATTDACLQPSGTVSDDTDCDDTDAAVNPAATEVCNGGIDDDCDGAADDADSAVTGTSTFYTDADTDGFGDASSPVEACLQPSGAVTDDTDCDDADVAVYPGATEVCNGGTDDDCDGLADEADSDVTDAYDVYPDADGDGYGDASGTATLVCTTPSGTSTDNTDCDDSASGVNPGATEVCDGSTDEDCDGLVDDADSSVTGTTDYFTDSDSDGYGDASSSFSLCVQPSGTVTDDTDCDDTDAAVNPAGLEVCNGGVDDDCNGAADDADGTTIGATAWYADSDADTYGNASTSVTRCAAPSGWTADDTDCDDTDAAVNPGATEVCNSGVDDDCNGLADDADSGVTGTTTFYADTDIDGYGDASSTTDACVQPSGTVTDATDCNDTDAAVNPAATEVCDDADVDEDCNGTADDADAGATGLVTWYADTDSDGYGDASSTTTACNQPSAYSADDTDCDDTDGAINPGADEICNGGVDDDCDGDADDADSSLTGATSYYPDIDGDGYGDDSSETPSCSAISGYITTGGDCDDADASVSPAETEVCDDGVDNDCDGGAAGCGMSGTYSQTPDADHVDTTYGDIEELRLADDSDGDGLAELVVWDSNGSSRGEVHRLEWDGSGWTELLTIESDLSAPGFGENGTGDVDGDGYDDTFVVAALDARYAVTGITYGWFGPVTGAQPVGSGADHRFHTGSGVGNDLIIMDVNHDDIDDIIAHHRSSSTTYVEYGPFTGTSGSYETFATSGGLEMTSLQMDGLFKVGDTNGDGYDDLVAGLYLDKEFGLFTELSYVGTRAGALLDSGTMDCRGTTTCAYFASSAGDTNGDGYDDIIVNDVYTRSSLGTRSVVYLGPVTSNRSSWDGEIRPENTRNDNPSWASPAGDIDGDGQDDVWVGASNQWTAGLYAGAVYGVLGPVTGVLTAASSEVRIYADGSYRGFGDHVVGGVDLTGDGTDDMVATDTNGPSIFLYMGSGL